MMYKLLLVIFASFFLINCYSTNNKIEKEKTDESETKEEIELIPYSDFINQLNWKSLTLKKRKERFFTFVNTDLIKYWKGTEWDFNGVTRTPKQGNIACGYFVTNTLTDFGFNIKRVWLAQQASSVMINKICENNSIKRFSSFDKLTSYLANSKSNEIFIIGLDYHTGYVIREGDKSYFLHSYFVNKQGVIKELVKDSDALKSSKTFMLGSLSVNSSLFK